MSYIGSSLLEEELRSMLTEMGREPGEVWVSDTGTSVRFRASIDGKTADFYVPEDILHNAPLSYVRERYLKPVLVKLSAALDVGSEQPE